MRLNLLPFLLTLSTISALNIPSNFPQCRRNEPNLNECLLRATETVKPNLVTGLKSLGIPSIDPFYSKDGVTFGEGTARLNYKLVAKNLVVRGFDSYEFKKFEFDPETVKFTFEVAFREVNSTSNIKFNGKVLALYLEGEGTLLTYLEPATYKITVQGNVVKRKTVEYLRIKSVNVDMNYNYGTGTFENFKGAREEIVLALNNVIRQNAEYSTKTLRTIFQEIVRKLVLEIFTELAKRFSYEELLPVK